MNNLKTIKNINSFQYLDTFHNMACSRYGRLSGDYYFKNHGLEGWQHFLKGIDENIEDDYIQEVLNNDNKLSKLIKISVDHFLKHSIIMD